MEHQSVGRISTLALPCCKLLPKPRLRQVLDMAQFLLGGGLMFTFVLKVGSFFKLR